MSDLELVMGRVDLRRGTIARDGAEVGLTEREVALLRHLADRPHQDVSRDELLRVVWSGASDGAGRAVDTAMRRLRMKVERDPANPDHLITIHGTGYRFVPIPVPPPSELRPPRSAPAPASVFVGRSGQLAGLERALADARRVTVTGPPGVGKTRLALELLDRGRGGYPGGAFLVPLTDVAGSSAALGAIASALGAPLPAGAEAPVAAAALVATLAGRGPVLLVLDGIDRVDPLAWTAGAWLAAAPSVDVVATSRIVPRLPGEAVVRVAPLGEEEAVALYVERVRRFRPGYAPAASEREVIGAIARRLDGIPASIELAAARANVLGPKQLLERLSARFQLLAGPGSGLRAGIDASWSLLDEPLRTCFAGCAVFAGPFDAAAARAVLGDEGVARVEDLSRRSLVERRPIGEGARYALLETLRAYARERLEASGALQETVARHAAHYLAFAEERAAAFLERGCAAALDDLEGEREHVVSAFRGRLQQDPETAARLANALAPLLHARGPAELAVALLDDALQRQLPPPLRARTLGNRAYSLRRRGEYDAATADYEEAVAILEPLGEARLLATALSNYANLFVERGELERAVPMAERALALHRIVGDARGVAVVSGDLAVAYKLAGRRVDARALYEEALAGHQATGNRVAEGLVLGNLAILAAEAGELRAAEGQLRRALAIHRESRNRRPEAVALANLGQVLEHLGDLDGAERHLEEALAIYRELGNRRLVAVALGNLAGIDLRRGRLAAAERRLDEAIGLEHEIGNHRDEGSLRVVLAGVRWRSGRLEEAESQYGVAIALLERSPGAEGRIAGARAFRAALRATRGDLIGAEAELALADAILGEGAALAAVLRGVLDVARAAAARRAGEDPERHLQEAARRLALHATSEEPEVGRAREVLESTLDLFRGGASVG